MFKYCKFLVPVFLVNSSVFASSGFFVGGSVNLQQNAYSKSGANTNSSTISKVATSLTQQISDLQVEISNLKEKRSKNRDTINEVNASLPERLQIYYVDRILTVANIITSQPELITTLGSDDRKIYNTIIANNIDVSTIVNIPNIGSVESLTKENTALNKQITEKEIELNTLQASTGGQQEITNNATTNAELDQIKSSDSKIEPSISLLAGYSVKNGNFGFITEAGVDLNSSKIGNSDGRSLEVKNIYNLYLTQKVGYYLHREMLAYVTAGLSIKDTKVNYNRDNNLIQINIEEKKILPNLILGLGFERILNKNLAMFGEFNHIFSLTSVKTTAGDVKTRSEQVRIGARYYF